MIDFILPKMGNSPNGDPEIQISCVSNVYIRMMHFKHSGDIEQGHTHQFDHTTLLASGSVEITVDGHVKTFIAPQMIFIKKDSVHELKALEDGTVAYCIHAIRDGEAVGDIIDPNSVIIPPGAPGVDIIDLDSKLSASIVDSNLL